MSSIENRALHQEQVVDEEVVRVNVGFLINGTSNPDAVYGDELTGQTVTRAGAGHFTFTLLHTAVSLLGAHVSIQGSGAEVIAGRVDLSSNCTTGAYVIYTNNASGVADPADDDIVWVELVLKCTARKAIV